MDAKLLRSKKITIYDVPNDDQVSKPVTANYFTSKIRKKPAEAERPNRSARMRRSGSRYKSDDFGPPIPTLEPTPELTTYGDIKLGWIQGVLIPCLLNIWGVMLFLRMSWIVAQAGILITIGIILASGVVCVITTLSLSALCTNGRLKGGGVYYLVSRSLGAELGASVGVIFAFANAVAASMNTIGFCDSLNDLFKAQEVKIFENPVNNTRLIGTVALLVMCLICAVGMEWETKTQNFLILVIVLAIFNFILGVILGPQTDTEIAQGFVGVNLATITENAQPDFRYSSGLYHNVFTVFAMYFPAVTGVQAGANICGDLKNPATAIPKGTLLALGISMLSYAMVAVLCGAGALRDASGVTGNLTHAALSACSPNCTYGLHKDYEIMHLMSAWGPLIYGGCWAATLSTALTNLLSVPRLIQALGVDRIYPGLIFFSKPYGKHGEPYRGYVLTFCVSMAFLLIADLNTIAPLITNFYLASYALINFCTFHASLVHHISWRPTFQWFNMWVSLLGAVLCAGIMVMLSWLMTMITVFVFLVLYLIVLYRKPVADWGSSTDAQRYFDLVRSVVTMNQRRSVKSYNPQVLVLAGPAGQRPALIHMASRITRDTYCLVAEICEAKLSPSEREARIAQAYQWIRSLRSGFFTLVDGNGLESGVRALLQAAGLGGLAPNILLLGYKYDWTIAKDTDVYVKVIQLAFEHKMGVALLRTTGEQRSSEKPAPARKSVTLQQRSTPEMLALMYQNSDLCMADANASSTDESVKSYNNESRSPSITWKLRETESYQRLPLYYPLASSPPPRPGNYKPMKLQNGTLDAWWLYEDGGLNILLPYIIAYRSADQPARMRIFALARDACDKVEAERRFATLLARYRISYDALSLLSDVGDPPKRATQALFHDLIRHKQEDCLVAEEDLSRWQVKTNRHLRLRELVLENSANATFVVMNLPMPRKGVPAALYMAWLEILSQDLPPMLFVRGNQQVLTAEA